jgi:hypothetical protein
VAGVLEGGVHTGVAVTCRSLVPGVVVPAFLLPVSCYRHCRYWEPWDSPGSCRPLRGLLVLAKIS